MELTSTYFERKEQRMIEAGILSPQFRSEIDNFGKEILDGVAEKIGINPSGQEMNKINADLQEQTDLIAEFNEKQLTGEAKIIFEHLGKLIHPERKWESLALDEQDIYRETAEEVSYFDLK